MLNCDIHFFPLQRLEKLWAFFTAYRFHMPFETIRSRVILFAVRTAYISAAGRMGGGILVSAHPSTVRGDPKTVRYIWIGAPVESPAFLLVHCGSDPIAFVYLKISIRFEVGAYFKGTRGV